VTTHDTDNDLATVYECAIPVTRVFVARVKH